MSSFPDPFAKNYERKMYETGQTLQKNPELRGMLAGQTVRPMPTQSKREASHGREWPEPLAEQAFHGITGEIIGAIEPHTEADPAALLFQFLAGFGNLVGRSPHTIADASRHGCNLFTAIVGVSSKGRKGTALNHVLGVLEAVDQEWARGRIKSGLSSGEGLIWNVRDPIEKPTAEGEQISGNQAVHADAGVSDKRLLVTETELASVLRVMERHGSTLSTEIRQAWDTGKLSVLTKNSPAQATGAHISIIGHITRDELLRFLSTTDAGNGFANRFLWVCSKRSKELPEGGDIQSVNFAPLTARLTDFVRSARETGEVRRDDPAKQIWREVYHDLSKGKPGLFGSVTGRSEPQVLRLALLYALLDGAKAISAPHMLAALAAWDYCEASARFIFGDSLGYPEADKILTALRESALGLTRTEIRDLFGRNRSETAILAALTALEEHGLVSKVQEKTEGRSAERWIAVTTGTT